mgnify:FL=1
MLNNGQQHSIEKSRQLQRNLYLAAKKDKQRRFHALYDRIFRLDILWRAWKEVRENMGSAGIDNITFEMVEEYGVEEYLLDIQEDLQNKEYRPKPVKSYGKSNSGAAWFGLEDSLKASSEPWIRQRIYAKLNGKLKKQG